MGECDKFIPPQLPPPSGDWEDPFFPPPPPEPGSCTVDSDCPEGYVCVDGICVPDPGLPGGPNTIIFPPGLPSPPTTPPPGLYPPVIPGPGIGTGGEGAIGIFPLPEEGGEGSGTGGGGDLGTGDIINGGGGTPGEIPDINIDIGEVPGSEGNEIDELGGENANNIFVCKVQTPIPDPNEGNPKDQVPGGDTLRIDGEGSVNETPTKFCDNRHEDGSGEGVGGPSRGGGCCDIEEEDRKAGEFCELREKLYDENGWEVTDRSQEPYETGFSRPFAGTLGKGKETFDHSVNCQAQNGQELWNINDGITHKDCFLPDKYDAIKWEPRGYIFCRRVDFAHDTQVWRDSFIGDLRKYGQGAAEGESPEELAEVSGMRSARRGGDRIPRAEQTRGRLFVENATTLYDCLSVKEWAYFNDTVTVREATTLNDNLFVQTDGTLYDTLYVRRDAVVKKSMLVKEDIWADGKLNVEGRARVDLLVSKRDYFVLGDKCWKYGKFKIIDPETFSINFEAQTYRADTIEIEALLPYCDDNSAEISSGYFYKDDPYCLCDDAPCEKEIIVQGSGGGGSDKFSSFTFSVTLPKCDDDDGEMAYEYEFMSNVGFAAYRSISVTATGVSVSNPNSKRGVILCSPPITFTMTITVTHAERDRLYAVEREEMSLDIKNVLSRNRDNDTV